MANRNLQLSEPRIRIRFIKEDLHKHGIKPLLRRNYARLFRRRCCTSASSTPSKQACQASLQTIRAWIEAKAFHVARHDPPAIAIVESGASVAQAVAIWRGSGRGGNPKDEEERVQADLDPSAPKRRQGKGSGGGDEVEQENEGEGGLVAVRKSVKLIQGYRLDGKGEKGKTHTSDIPS